MVIEITSPPVVETCYSTGHENNACKWLRECCMQVQAGVVSRIQLHPNNSQALFLLPLFSCPAFLGVDSTEYVSCALCHKIGGHSNGVRSLPVPGPRSPGGSGTRGASRRSRSGSRAAGRTRCSPPPSSRGGTCTHRAPCTSRARNPRGIRLKERR